ncbi:MAG: hypothetical protein QXL96_01780 [Ignisphaera sp.]
MTIFSKIIKNVVEESAKVLVAREKHVAMIVFSVIAEGHVLIEGVPG